MQPNDDLQSTDSQLREVLNEWSAPQVSESLEQRVLGAAPRQPVLHQAGWRFLLNGYIRVPVPLACCLTVVMIFAAWRSVRPAGAAPCSLAAQPIVCKSAVPGVC